MKFLSKISIIFLFLISTFYLLPSVAHANISPQANYPAVNTNPDVPNNLHNWTQNVMIEVMSSLTCQLAGVDPINPKQSCLGADTKTGKIGFLPSPQTGGAIGFMGNMISVLYTPPLHTADYFRDLASNFGISKKTYAQNAGGTGFQSLTPLIGVWSAFRNIVYLFLVIIFVVIGLAIMLRVKIDPRTVMTIQNQIPKIIIGILAVTFSFAIAGFLIDMMWVLIYLFYGIFNGIPGVDVNSLNPTLLQNTSVIGGAMGIGDVAGLSARVAGSGSEILRQLLGIANRLDPFFIPGISAIGNFIPGIKDSLNPNGATGMNFIVDTISAITAWTVGIKFLTFPAPEGTFLGIGGSPGWLINTVFAIPGAIVVNELTQTFLRFGLPWVIIFLIVLIAILTALFRLWFTLIMAYVQILLAVVLAPFWIIGGIVPGSPISLGGWLKNIGANLLAFPVTIAMFMLGKVFMDSFGKTPAEGQNFVPPLIGNPGDPSLIGALIGLGILLMTPNVVNMLKAALKAPKTDMMGSIGKAIGAGTGTLSSPLKPVITGFSFLAGQRAAKKLPFIGGFVREAEQRQQQE